MADRLGMALQMAQQTVKAGTFIGLNALSSRRVRRQGGGAQNYRPERATPSRAEMMADLRGLFLADAQAVADGIYPRINERSGNLPELAQRLRAVVTDVDRAFEASQEGRVDAARDVAGTDNLPDYFLQDFHFQDGGYLTDNSARLYDLQVETLFAGTAGAMRRQGLRPIADAMAGRDQRHVRIADVACGTGRFLGQILQAYPAVQATGIDLAGPYIDDARRHLGIRRNLTLRVGNAEALPLEDASQDIVTCIYLFHELPREVRRTVIGEFARVLKPGGTLVFIDSLQWGDRPGWDGLLESFPVRFHEPYFVDYLEDDLDGAMAKAGLSSVATWPAFLSKIMVRRKAD